MTELFGGAELGGTKCVLAVAENPTSIIKRIEVPTTTPGKTLKNIFDFFGNYDLKSIGIGTFGPIILDRNSENYGLLISESKKGWEGTNLFTEFRNSFDLMINIDTDVNAAAIGEYNYGAGQGCQPLV